MTSPRLCLWEYQFPRWVFPGKIAHSKSFEDVLRLRKYQRVDLALARQLLKLSRGEHGLDDLEVVPAPWLLPLLSWRRRRGQHFTGGSVESRS
jgi:hypothetical protein